ncbi:MAG: class I SAM-dependent methyltransferase [Candidatus Magasanikbacteria bacterium]|nr:class I SAM-dependent methyltransferase [Candidatus Magasanikbacteria bacterium]
MLVVRKAQYQNFLKYCDLNRWSSYWYQIKEILSLKPESVLEIGVGDRTTSSYLKNNTSINYKSVDISEELKPDIVCDVANLSSVIKPNSFDVVCAFEVLEHLPFEKFKTNLQELGRATKKNVIISLPHWGRHFSMEIRLPYFKKWSWKFKSNFFSIPHVFDGHHYWEIGKRNYSLSIVKSEISKAGFDILKDYVVFESPYHHFFILQKKSF